MSQNIDQILNELKSALKTGAASGAGITDSASRQQIAINDNGVVLTKLRLDRILGDLTVENKVNSTEVNTGVVNATTINVTNEITATTIRAKRIITEQDQDSYNKAITFYGTNRQDLDQINGVPVLEEGRISDSVTSSNLTKVGTLLGLKIDGNISVGQTFYANDLYNRVSVNTEQMLSAVTIQDAGVLIVLGGDESTGAARIGTWGSNKLSLITDNTDRITMQGNSVVIGNAKSKNAEVTVNGEMSVTGNLRIGGELHVAKLTSDTRMQRSSSLDFVATETESVYGKGIQWKGEGNTRSFFLAPNFDRFVCSESIDLNDNRAYYINKSKVLDLQNLGESVKTSSLTRVGVLSELAVSGSFTVDNHLEVSNNAVTVTRPFAIKDLTGDLNFTANKIETTSKDFAIVAATDKILSVNNLGDIALGDKQRTDRNINVFGKLSVNVTNPNPEVDLQVDGAVMFGGKKFITSARIPETGVWTKGDIAWNSQPEDTGFIGWVCITGGKPGEWKSFGYIGK